MAPASLVWSFCSWSPLFVLRPLCSWPLSPFLALFLFLLPRLPPKHPCSWPQAASCWFRPRGLSARCWAALPVGLVLPPVAGRLGVAASEVLPHPRVAPRPDRRVISYPKRRGTVQWGSGRSCEVCVGGATDASRSSSPGAPGQMRHQRSRMILVRRPLARLYSVAH